MTSEELFVSKAVLEGEERGPLVQKRTNQFREVGIRGRLYRDQDEIRGADLGGCIVTVDRGEMNVLLLTDDVQSFLANGRKVAPHQKMHVATRRRQFVRRNTNQWRRPPPPRCDTSYARGFSLQLCRRARFGLKISRYEASPLVECEIGPGPLKKDG